MGNFDDRDKRPPQPVIIEDKRHRGDEDEAAEPEAEAAPEAPSVEAPPVVSVSPDHEVWPQEPDPLATAQDIASDADSLSPEELAAMGELSEEQLNAAQQAEMAYLMQLFQLGQTGYLRSQLGVLLNFAMINLGRMPNPATGIVTADLEQAKTAIDVFEFILVKVQAQLDPRERAELTQLLSDMKYTFMQALGGPGGTAPPGVGLG